MTRLTDLSPQTLESLSAYLDAEVSEKERREIERRLADDVSAPGIGGPAAGAPGVAHLATASPAAQLHAHPRDGGPEAARGAGYPALRLATALATLGFVVTMGLDAFGSRLLALPMARQFGGARHGDGGRLRGKRR